MKKIIFVLIPLAFFISCEKDELESNQIVGDWKLANMQLKANLADDGPIEINENLSDLNYIVTFKSDGTYISKIDDKNLEKLDEIDWAEIGLANNKSGTYQIVNDLVTMKYFDEENNQNITNKFVFKKVSNDEFYLSMDRPSYFAMIKEQLAPGASYLASFGITIDQLMKEIEADIKAFDLKITYSKVK
jgi:hypothetical protein